MVIYAFYCTLTLHSSAACIHNMLTQYIAYNGYICFLLYLHLMSLMLTRVQLLTIISHWPLNRHDIATL